MPAHLVSQADLESLEAEVEGALRSGRDSALRVLGWGEISLVLGSPFDAPEAACKRLPVFKTRERFDAYASAIEDYIAVLQQAGIVVVETEVRSVERHDGIAAYVVQPVLPRETLAVSILSSSDPRAGHPIVESVIHAVAEAVRPTLALDSQISNWTWNDGRLRYFDVTTPLFWSVDGSSRLDVDLLTQALPWALRGMVRRFAVPGILDRYRKLRMVLIDLCANLIKERLAPWIPAFIDNANRHLDEPITEEECRKYYRADALLWEFMLRIRRLDRAWQQSIRHRPYPYLLPKSIER